MMNCDLYLECPYCVERELPRKGRVLSCIGEWGRTCLIWKKLEVLIPTTGYKGRTIET
jgi:hypothetical protein